MHGEVFLVRFVGGGKIQKLDILGTEVEFPDRGSQTRSALDMSGTWISTRTSGYSSPSWHSALPKQTRDITTGAKSRGPFAKKFRAKKGAKI